MVAAYTGFRAGEMAELMPSDFALDAPTPVVWLAADETKNRKEATQPLPRELTDHLRVYLAARVSGSPVWPGTWHEKAADMMRLDLEAAGIPFAVTDPDGRTRVADFHALRHTLGVLAEQGGATLREEMTLMRHSDPKLTMRTYGRLKPHELSRTVEGIPSLVRTAVPQRDDPQPPDQTLSLTLSLGVDVACGAVRNCETRPGSGKETEDDDGE